MPERIHIAGAAIRVGNLLRQRCAWCDAVLIDVDLSCMMVAAKADGSPGDPYRTWETCALVAVDGPGQWVVHDEGPGSSLPLRCCASQRKLELVEKEAPGG